MKAENLKNVIYESNDKLRMDWASAFFDLDKTYLFNEGEDYVKYEQEAVMAMNEVLNE